MAGDSDLTPSQRDSLKRAQAAFQKGNIDYAITLLEPVVKGAPLALDVRRLFREACIKKHAGGVFHVGGFALMKAQGALKNDPIEALSSAEDVLKTDPFHKGANEVISKAGVALDHLELAAFGLETIVRHDPKDTKTLHLLAKLYLDHKDGRARDVYRRLLDVAPTDGAAISGYKNAEAIISMDPNRPAAAPVEARPAAETPAAAKTEEQIDQQIAELYEKHEADPDNLVIMQKLARLYKDKHDYDNAVQWLEFASGKSGGNDAGLERMLYDLKLKRIDTYIQQCQDAVAVPDLTPEERADAQATLQAWEQQRAQFVVEASAARVKKYPNDLEARFDLAEALFKSGDVSAAIPEFQAAQKQPNLRIRAMTMLALCFKEKGQLPIAAKRLAEAESELHSMDDLKKSVVYELGLIYEQMGETQKAHDEFAKIYEVDYGYKDIASRVESHQQT